MSVSVMTIQEKQLKLIGLANTNIYYQLNPDELTEQTINRGEGVLNNTGALCINTGEFTGRSPQDKFTVKDAITENAVYWNNFNLPIEEKYFFQLKEKLLSYLDKINAVWVRD